jgi:hypothetical protein
MGALYVLELKTTVPPLGGGYDSMAGGSRADL